MKTFQPSKSRQSVTAQAKRKGACTQWHNEDTVTLSLDGVVIADRICIANALSIIHGLYTPEERAHYAKMNARRTVLAA